MVTTGSGGWYERSKLARSPLQSFSVRREKNGCRLRQYSRTSAWFACAMVSTPGPSNCDQPPTWSEWPWVKTIARSGLLLTAAKRRLISGASKCMPVLISTSPSAVVTR